MTRGEEIKRSNDIKLLKDLIMYYFNNRMIEVLLNSDESLKNNLRLKILIVENGKSFFSVRV